MATILDISLLQSFSGVFTFILVFAITYAILGLTNVLGKDTKSLNGIVAFCVAIFLSISTKPRTMVEGMIPWFAMMAVFVMFLLLAMRFMFGEGAGDKMMLNVLGGKNSAGWWIFIVMGAILLISFSATVGPGITPGANQTSSGTSETIPSGVGDAQVGSTQTGNWQTNVLNTIYHPKVLGAIILLVIALAAIKLLSTNPPPIVLE
jgi:hypothetical protein